MYERVLGPRGAAAETVVILDDPVSAESPDGRTRQLTLYVAQRPGVVMKLGGRPHVGLQGDESTLSVLSPQPGRGRWGFDGQLFAELNPSIAVKLETGIETLILSEDKGAGRLGAERINTALSIVDPGRIDPSNQSEMWRAAFRAKDLYPDAVKSFEDAASLAALAAQIRVMHPQTLKAAVNEWWVYGGDFATWVMEAKRPDLKREAFSEFKRRKSWQIFNAEMAALNDPEKAVNALPGIEVANYWKGSHALRLRDDPLYREIAWPLRHEAFADWVGHRPGGHFNHWSVNPNAEQPVNRLLRTMFFDDIKPLHIEGVETVVIADDKARVDFLTQGVTHRTFGHNIESAAVDRLGEIRGRITPRNFHPIFKTVLNLGLAYPGKAFRILGSDEFVDAFQQSLQYSSDSVAGGAGKNVELELYADYLAGGRLLFGDALAQVRNVQPEVLGRMVRLRKVLNIQTNRDPSVESLVRLGELQANMIIMEAQSAIPTSDGLVVENSAARNIFDRRNWMVITPPAGTRVAE